MDGVVKTQVIHHFSVEISADEKGFDRDCFFISFRFPVLRTHFFVVY